MDLLPRDSAGRKRIPIVSGVLNYFPAALLEVAKVSKAGNDKHNPGQPLHHARGKSTDHLDSAVRHIMEFEADHNAIDPDTGVSVLASALWRVAAKLQEHLESRGAPLAPGAKLPEGGK
jgi:hypothetical protein